MEIDKALYKACEDNIKLEEQLDKYKEVLDKIKKYVNDVIIDETYTNYINELLEEIE